MTPHDFEFVCCVDADWDTAHVATPSIHLQFLSKLALLQLTQSDCVGIGLRKKEYNLNPRSREIFWTATQVFLKLMFRLLSLEYELCLNDPYLDHCSYITSLQISKGNRFCDHQKSDHHPFSWNTGKKIVCCIPHWSLVTDPWEHTQRRYRHAFKIIFTTKRSWLKIFQSMRLIMRLK